MIRIMHFQHPNWGDKIAVPLAKRLHNGDVQSVPLTNSYFQPHYMVTGSIVRFANEMTTIWGAGFIAADSLCSRAPRKVDAVRGPMTRTKMMAQGIYCPEVYGDPAIIWCKLNPHLREASYRIGYVPHYVDRGARVDSVAEDKDIVLDITKDPVEVMVNQCEFIASSSLHGIILADAYGIPVTWLRISHGITGGEFKFRDYLATTGREPFDPIWLTPKTTPDQIMSAATTAPHLPDPEQLLDSCPFVDPSALPSLRSRLRGS